MNNHTIIKINFKGGIISPGYLYNIMVAVAKAGIRHVSFGLRQQLIIETSDNSLNILRKELAKLQVTFQTDTDSIPNIVSSYPAEEIFLSHNWLSEGVYKDIFDEIDYDPVLKINISNSDQSFTPLFTGNINWVASKHAHYWHLFIRFPKTNTIYEWDKLTYTNDVARLTKLLEQSILSQPNVFYGNKDIVPEMLFGFLQAENFILKPAEEKATLSPFNLPYYEGLNRYNDKSWLGIYERNEKFSVEMLKEICQVCMETKIGQICSTPWKSLIIKAIDEKHRGLWSRLLDKYSVNIRHAANELNFQVEDNSKEGLELKNYLVRYLGNYDIRTFGICFGIKTRRKSEVFCNILIRKRYLLDFKWIKLGAVYDILCAKDFNPNERTGSVYSSGNPKYLLPEQLRRAILSFYRQKPGTVLSSVQKTGMKKEVVAEMPVFVYQCKNCLSVYDEEKGEPQTGIPVNTQFEKLPVDYCCSLCESPKEDFIKIEKSKLGLQAV